MLVCEWCGDKGITPICRCGHIRVPSDALDDPELYGFQYLDDGRYDNDPNPYHGDYSEK